MSAGLDQLITSNSTQSRGEEGLLFPVMWCLEAGFAFGGMGTVLSFSLAGTGVLARSARLITSEDKVPSVLPSCHLAWVVDLLCAGHSLVLCFN